MEGPSNHLLHTESLMFVKYFEKVLNDIFTSEKAKASKLNGGVMNESIGTN